MSLQLEKEINNSGVSANYFKIHQIDLQRLEGVGAIIMLHQYKDKASKDAGKNPISVASVTLTDEVFINSILDLSYNAVKALPEFKDAVDI